MSKQKGDKNYTLEEVALIETMMLEHPEWSLRKTAKELSRPLKRDRATVYNKVWRMSQNMKR